VTVVYYRTNIVIDGVSHWSWWSCPNPPDVLRADDCASVWMVPGTFED